MKRHLTVKIWLTLLAGHIGLFIWKTLPYLCRGQRRKRLVFRGVAQAGSAPVLGTGGRWFESSRPDKMKKGSPKGGPFFVPSGREETPGFRTGAMDEKRSPERGFSHLA